MHHPVQTCLQRFCSTAIRVNALVAEADLVKFVHSCDYDLDKAKKCAKDFYWSRAAIPELFSGWDITLPNFESLFESAYVY